MIWSYSLCFLPWKHHKKSFSSYSIHPFTASCTPSHTSALFVSSPSSLSVGEYKLPKMRFLSNKTFTSANCTLPFLPDFCALPPRHRPPQCMIDALCQNKTWWSPAWFPLEQQRWSAVVVVGGGVCKMCDFMVPMHRWHLDLQSVLKMHAEACCANVCWTSTAWYSGDGAVQSPKVSNFGSELLKRWGYFSSWHSPSHMKEESRDASSISSGFWHDWGERRLISSGDSMVYEYVIRGFMHLH